MEVGDYVMITSSVEIEDNAKLYSRTETEWVFITDFSGATGIQGEQGIQGIQGIQGERGIGISKLEVIDGSLYVTLTDNTKQNAGIIITDEAKEYIINKVEENLRQEIDDLKQENQKIKDQLPSGTASGNSIYLDDSSDMELSVNKISGGYKQDTSIEPCLETPSEIETVNNSIAVNITNFEKDQIQSLVIPIQQEMLDGDYIADVEHHEWGKLILTGNEDFAFTSTKKYITLSSTKTEQLKDAYIEIEDSSNNVTPLISNNYVGGTQLEVTTAENIIAFTKWGDIIYLYFNALYEQLSEFRTILKTKYENGTPVIIYYKLQDAIDLELNEEQKAVKEKKLYTYKNITNINLSDDLVSVDVSYKKDLETQFDEKQDKLTAGNNITIEDNIISATIPTTTEITESGVELTSSYDNNVLSIALLNENGQQLSKVEQNIQSCEGTYIWDKTTNDIAVSLFQKVYNAYKNNKILDVVLADGERRYKLISISNPKSIANQLYCQFMSIDYHTNSTDFVFLQSINAVLTINNEIVTNVEVNESINQFRLIREYDGTNGALPTNNTKEYIPTMPYEPATKKYVDETHYKNFIGWSSSKTQVLKNINGVLQWVDG